MLQLDSYDIYVSSIISLCVIIALSVIGFAFSLLSCFSNNINKKPRLIFSILGCFVSILIFIFSAYDIFYIYVSLFCLISLVIGIIFGLITSIISIWNLCDIFSLT
jgi:hypothetical protein